MFLLRALIVWLLIIFAEVVHGVLRTLFLAPSVGDFRARQIGVFVGSLLILIVAYLFIRWIRAENIASLFGVGFVWLGLTLTFELCFGRFALNLSWDRILSDYNVAQGGLLPIGLVVLVFAPFITATLRGFKT